MRRRGGDQPLRFVPEPGRSSDDEGLIPLINVIFLILIFFMIVGHMEAAAPFRVDPPASRTERRPLSDDLTLLMAADGRIAIGQEVLGLDRLEPWLLRWAQSAEGAAAPSPPLPTVSVQADRGVQSGELRALLNTLRRAGFREVVLLTDRAR